MDRPFPEEEPDSSSPSLHPPSGFQDIVGDGFTCTACGVTIPRREVLTGLHQNRHLELERRLARR